MNKFHKALLQSIGIPICVVLCVWIVGSIAVDYSSSVHTTRSGRIATIIVYGGLFTIVGTTVGFSIYSLVRAIIKHLRHLYEDVYPSSPVYKGASDSINSAIPSSEVEQYKKQLLE